jgi:hypothetical protein
MTAQEMINRSLTLISRLGAGRTPGVSESQAAFGVLNAMLNSWSTNRLTVYSIWSGLYAAVAGTQTYTMGTGSSWNGPRPTKLSSASVIVIIGGTSQAFPLEIIDDVQWAALLHRNDASPIPRFLFNDYAYPVSNISLSPIPVGTPSIELHGYLPLTQFATLTDVVAFPQGYERAITYNLAVELGPLFELKVPDAVLLVAKESYENLAQLNAKIAGPRELADPRAALANANAR